MPALLQTSQLVQYPCNPSPAPRQKASRGSNPKTPRSTQLLGCKMKMVYPESRALPLEPLQYSPCSRDGEHRAKHLQAAEPQGWPQPWPRQRREPCDARGAAPAPRGRPKVGDWRAGSWGTARCCPERGAQELPAPQARSKRTESPFT